jgi:hypothetical protein
MNLSPDRRPRQINTDLQYGCKEKSLQPFSVRARQNAPQVLQKQNGNEKGKPP